MHHFSRFNDQGSFKPNRSVFIWDRQDVPQVSDEDADKKGDWTDNLVYDPDLNLYVEDVSKMTQKEKARKTLDTFVATHKPQIKKFKEEHTEYSGNWEGWNKDFAKALGLPEAKIKGVIMLMQESLVTHLFSTKDLSKKIREHVDGKMGPNTLYFLSNYAGLGTASIIDKRPPKRKPRKRPTKAVAAAKPKPSKAAKEALDALTTVHVPAMEKRYLELQDDWTTNKAELDMVDAEIAAAISTDPELERKKEYYESEQSRLEKEMGEAAGEIVLAENRAAELRKEIDEAKRVA